VGVVTRCDRLLDRCTVRGAKDPLSCDHWGSLDTRCQQAGSGAFKPASFSQGKPREDSYTQDEGVFRGSNEPYQISLLKDFLAYLLERSFPSQMP